MNTKISNNERTHVSEFRLKLYPKNFDLTKSFYQNILSFPIITEWNEADDDCGVMFDTGAGIIELLTPEEYIPVAACSISLAVKDVWTLWSKLKDITPIVHALRDNAWGDISFAIKDPEGFAITFFTKR